MYGEVVLGVVAANEHDEPPFDKILDEVKAKHRANRDQDLKEDALREAVAANPRIHALLRRLVE
jgi:hypothetical protein